SLFFIAGIDPDDNELLVLEIIHRYVEILDKWFLNVCELDIIFNFQHAYQIMDELLIGGELQESSKRAVIAHLKKMEDVEREEQAAQTMETLSKFGLGSL
ncbi:snare-like protein, partial [Caulochytrium protostelioides]